MKKFVYRAEKALVAVVLNPRLRPAEYSLAVAVAKNVAIRWGLSSAVLAGALELIDRVMS